MQKRKAPLHRRVHHFLLPHKGNGYRPHVFRTTSIAVLIVVALLIEGAYLGATKLVFPNTNFLASVLPSSLIALTNTDRQAQDIGTVIENAKLDEAARLAAEDMAAKGYFAHVAPDGTTPWHWLELAGYQYKYAGQNLAVNFTDSADVETAWMKSPTHRANIVKSEYTEIGIGVANGVYKGKDVTFVVQYFATPETGAATPTAKVAEKGTASVEKPAAPAVEEPQKVASAPEPALAQAAAPVVLGTEAPVDAGAPSAIAVFFARLATSPTAIVIYILSALAVIIGILFIIAIVVKARVQYVEVIGGGLLILFILVGLLLLDVQYASSVIVPSAGQSAANTVN